MLSPEADEVIESFDINKVYVIGGIVDRSVKKAASLDWAKEHGLRTMRLPVQEYIPHRETHVLNIDTVVSIILAHQERGDWEQVLTACMPLRRQNGGKNLTALEVDDDSKST